MPKHTHITSQQLARGRAREAGFSLIEIIIALAIIAILSAIIALSWGKAKSGTRKNEAIAAASRYAQAISQYQGDNANQLPGAANMDPADARRGPVNLVGKPYIGTLPDGVIGGRIEVSMACAPPTSSSTTTAQIALCPATEGAPSFAIRVMARPRTNIDWGVAAEVTTCWMGSTGAQPACSR